MIPQIRYGSGKAEISPYLSRAELLIFHFNYVYNPSCAYNERWGCPLAPTENHLSIATPAGEQRYIC